MELVFVGFLADVDVVVAVAQHAVDELSETAGDGEDGDPRAFVTGDAAGRVVDRLGARRATLAGLAGIAAAAAALASRPERLGVPGYLAPMAALTASYALFQAANTTGVMQRVDPADRGVFSGALGLARNLGLVTGACVMGAVFALGAGASDIATAPRGAVAQGMRTSYALAAALIAPAFALVAASTTTARKEICAEGEIERGDLGVLTGLLIRTGGAQ